MLDIIVHILLLAVAVFAVAQLLPGIRLTGFGAAIWVAIVYSLVNMTLGAVLRFLGFPFIIVTLGLFLLVINVFLLWLTDLFVEDFEIRDTGTLIIGSILITFTHTVLGWVF